MITTDCKDCIFNIKKNNEQTGCYANRINRLIDLGKVNYKWDQDENVGSFTINGVCNLKTINKLNEQSLSDALEYARFRADNVIDLIIYVNDMNKDINPTLSSAYNQQIGFHKNRVIVNSKKYTSIDKSRLKNYVVHRLPSKEEWKLSLDVVVGQITDVMYYCLVKSGTKIPPELTKNITTYINDMCLPLYCVYDKDFIVMSVHVHKLLGGSFSMSIFQKLKNLYHEESQYILSYKELHDRINSYLSGGCKSENENSVSEVFV